jgi:hypothetical protein
MFGFFKQFSHAAALHNGSDLLLYMLGKLCTQLFVNGGDNLRNNVKEMATI